METKDQITTEKIEIPDYETLIIRMEETMIQHQIEMRRIQFYSWSGIAVMLAVFLARLFAPTDTLLYTAAGWLTTLINVTICGFSIYNFVKLREIKDTGSGWKPRTLSWISLGMGVLNLGIAVTFLITEIIR